MKIRTMTAVAGLLMAAGVANAGISFSFADPAGGRQMSNVKDGVAAGVGLLTYDQNAVLAFIVDGSEEGFGNVIFNNARMELRMELSPATTVAGVTSANVNGSFIIRDADTGNEIVRGESEAGAYIRVAGTNSILFSSPDGFSYTAGPALQAFLAPGRVLAPEQEAVFTLTDIVTPGGGGIFATGGVFKSFTANASFSGNTEVVPAPGAFALVGAAGLLVAGRRRR
jgi:hypothetical protein